MAVLWRVKMLIPLARVNGVALGTRRPPSCTMLSRKAVDAVVVTTKVASSSFQRRSAKSSPTSSWRLWNRWTLCSASPMLSQNRTSPVALTRSSPGSVEP
jgi:hypothetical protein